MRPHRRTFIAVVALVVLVVAGLVDVSRSNAVTPTGGAGCSTSRVAVAHHAGGAVVAGATGAPVPCQVQTGFGGAETRIAVTKDGTVVYEPATQTPGLLGTGFVPGAPGPKLSTSLQTGGLATTSDQGAHWQFVKPGGATWVPQDDQIYVDRTTGRIFYYALSPNPVPQTSDVPIEDQIPAGHAHLMVSGNDGKTWSYSALTPFVESENPRFATAPAPKGGAQPVGYPNDSYWCGNDMLFFWAAPVIPGYRTCYRSLNGGRSWTQMSTLFSQPVPVHSECGTNPEVFNAGDGNYPEPAPDGSLFVTVVCGSNTFLAKSTNEGSTWPILKNRTGNPLTIPPTDELRVDETGNLYSVHLNGKQLLLRISRDGGLDWSAPLDMTAPGVTSISQWFVAQRGSAVAVSYLATTGSSAGLDGYLTVTRDALATSPLFWSSTINPPGKPLVTGSPAEARDDFIGADIGPDGTPWASFFTSCSDASTPGCAGAPADPQATGAVAGRLAFS